MNNIIKNYPLEDNVVFSNEQIKAVEIENNNILVSAAAGSGKTKVLVERIVKELEIGICNINEMLIMTFTKAATAEMKNRIKTRIDERIRFLRNTNEIKDNKERINRLKNQNLLLQNANIQTIDSFCKRLVDENFNALEDMDCKYRVVDTGELNIIKNDLLDKFLENNYYKIDKEYNVDFNKFFKSYFKHNDDKIREILLDGIDFLDSLVNVDDFFDIHLNNYDKKQKEINESIKNTDDETIIWLKDIKVDSIKEEKLDYIILVLLKRFYDILSKEKINRKIVEISDFQKLAIKILNKTNENNEKPYALNYQNKFKRILVDEYQDTSDIQEHLIKLLSNDFKNYNVFMVGDVKQCIYAFRNARPDNFNEKYESFEEIDYKKDVSHYENKNVLIKLNKNYRSSNEVINTTNTIFNNLMIKEYGSIDYKEDGVPLIHGRDEEKNTSNVIDKNTEFIYFLSLSTKMPEELLENIKLKQMKMVNNDTEHYEVEDRWRKDNTIPYILEFIKKLHDENNIQYKNIVILHPTPTSLVEYFMKESAKRNIPFQGNVKAGFYNSYEIVLMTAILSVLDNPINDVDLSTVLLSIIINITDDDMILIKYIDEFIKEKQNNVDLYFSLYESILNIHNSNEYINELIENKKITKTELSSLKNKIDYYFALFNELKIYRNLKSLSELVSIIYDKTNIYNYMRNMTNGNIRIENLDLFLNKAKAFESTSYSGLFNFMRYIEQIKINQIDESPATVYNENDDAIRLISIHQSKGLEYDVVIIPNLDSSLKPKNDNKEVVFDKDYGIGAMEVDLENKNKHISIKKYLIDKKKQDEEKQEKIRLLYVGLTRAREKLVLSMKVNNDLYFDLFKEEKPKKTKSKK